MGLLLRLAPYLKVQRKREDEDEDQEHLDQEIHDDT